MKLINYEEYKNKLLKVRDSIPLTVPAASYELMLEKTVYAWYVDA